MDHLKPSLANSTPVTPLSFLERAAVVYDDCPSVVYNSTTYTWAQTHRRCLQVASSITKLGLGRGHVISVVAPNVPAAYELNFAVPMSGAILNNINTRLDSKSVFVILQHSESKLVFVYYQLLPIVQQAMCNFPIDHPRPILVLISDDENDNNTLLQSRSKKLTTYEDMVRTGDPKFEWIRPVTDLSPMVLNYTSGTTSSPKGVVHCHKGLFIIAMDALLTWDVPKRPVFLWTLPMFHVNGWSYTWGMAAVGATNICLRKFDGAIVYANIRRHHVTHMCAAPVVLNMLINLNPNPNPLPRSVHLLTAGSPPPTSVILRAESLGFVVEHGYGLTETGGIVVSCAWKPQWNRLPAMERARLKSRQGIRTLGATRIDVIDPKTGQPMNNDGKSIGEIVIKGRTVMLGYLKDPEATLKCMGKDEWFRTGDLGVIHPDGYLEIKDRSKDIIISGGENISSVEIETVLYSFPAVSEAAVVARPDEFWGETPCAFVSVKQGFLDGRNDPGILEREIIEYCKERMAHYMVPKTVVLKKELPKTSTGKIQKFMLREEAKSLKSRL